VRPKTGAPSIAKPEELVEYAACLTKLGAAEEALVLLSKVEGIPRALLYQALALAARWRYAENIPLLKAYLATPGLSAYQRHVGEINLAAALVFEGKHREVTPLLRCLLYNTSLSHHTLLLGNCLELSAENLILQGKIDAAKTCLEEATRKLGKTDSIYEFLARKWGAVVLSFHHPKSAESHQALQAVRKEAQERLHWESLRELDRFDYRATKDPALFHRVYAGTPYENFRRKLEQDADGTIKIASSYLWQLGEGEEPPVVVDLVAGTASKGTPLKLGSLPHRLILTLSSDFYRPFRIGELFSRLFPGEFYNPVSSVRRVHQALAMLREWLEQAHLPLLVEETRGEYRISTTRPCSIRVPVGDNGSKALPGRVNLSIARMREVWPSETFSSEEAASALKISARSVRRLLSEAVEEGELKRVGKRRGVRYHFG